jgi:hypothetical protein
LYCARAFGSRKGVDDDGAETTAIALGSHFANEVDVLVKREVHQQIDLTK